MADSLQSKVITRSRTKPNLQVTEEQYKDALYALLVAQPPLLDMRSKLGPILAKHVKQVTPGHLVSLEKLWHPLINNGCKQLVLQSLKIKLALFKLVHENSLLIQAGTPPVLIPCIVDDVRQHIMDCASGMRALKNGGMQGGDYHAGLASVLKSKMVGVHMPVLGPILKLMELSENVVMEPGSPCPLSPSIDLESIPMLPPANLAVLGACTPSKSQRLQKKVTPEKLMRGTNVGDVQVGGSSMGEGKGDPTMSQQLDVPDAIDAEVGDCSLDPEVSGDCPLDPEVGVDEDGYPTIFGDIIMSEAAVDEDGYPTIFVDIIMAEGKEAMQDDDRFPSIKPINPNVRARKLEVNAAAQALLEEGLANGVAPPVKKRLKSKQTTKSKTLKSRMIEQWHPSAEASKEPHTKRVSKAKAKPKPVSKAKAKPKAKCTEPKEDEPKAEGDAQAQQVRTACRGGIKHADAVIMSAFGSSNACTCRFDIQGKCKLADGTIRKIGILGFNGQLEKWAFFANLQKTLLHKMNSESGLHTKGEMISHRDELIASCKAGHPC